MTDLRLNARPVIVVIAGPNGAGKSTFYHSHLKQTGLRFVNADILTRELDVDPYSAAKIAELLRNELIRQRESFIFETVLSDPVGEKIQFLEEAVTQGYNVVFCFVWISSAEVSEQRVAMRVAQGGHDVPTDKIRDRFPRVLANLKSAIQRLPYVVIFDNDEIKAPYRQVAVFENGNATYIESTLPPWLVSILK